MSTELTTARLRLRSLSKIQLNYCLNNMNELEKELGLSISKKLVDDNVVRAINMKLNKMTKADLEFHDWFTYWLIIINNKPIGIGLIGFKGYPNEKGETEIGYGIDSDYWNQGYMTEAVKILCGRRTTEPNRSICIK